MPKAQLKPFFEPRNIAIVGVSRTPGRPGFWIANNLIRHSFKGEIYPINPKHGDFMGVKVYPSVEDIPGDIDLAVLMTSARETPNHSKECVAKGAKGIIVVSGGFSEVGEEGARLEKEIVDIAHKAGVRVMGPNMVGPINPSNNLAVSITPIKNMSRGHVALLSQTGLMLGVLSEWMTSHWNIQLGKMVDLGNKADIDDADILEYLEDDEETKVIAVHMEGVKNGKRFLDAARKTAPEKPIIAFKTGSSESGAKSAASHTGSIAGNDLVVDAAFKQSGIIRVYDLDEFFGVIKAFVHLSLPEGSNVGIVGYSGGLCTMTVDACEKYGLKLAGLSRETMNKIEQVYPTGFKASHPVDLGPAMTYDANKVYETGLDAVITDNNVNCMILAIPIFPLSHTCQPNNFDAMVKIIKGNDKPLVVYMAGDEERAKRPRDTFEDAGIPTYSSITVATKALAALVHYKEFRNQIA